MMGGIENIYLIKTKQIGKNLSVDLWQERFLLGERKGDIY